MQISAFASLVFLTQALATPGGGYMSWAPPGEGDLRGPCPMLNTLSNHGFLPHNGRNFTRKVMVRALEDALNWDPEFGDIVWQNGVIANPEPNATEFDLAQVSKHNVLEKDASLTRADAYFGDSTLFNQTIFDSTRKWWQGRSRTLNMLANSKISRQLESRRDNPTYSFSKTADAVSSGEIASIFTTFGDREAMVVDRELVESWLTTERFPTHLGWTLPRRLDSEGMGKVLDEIAKAYTLLTDFEEPNGPGMDSMDM